jgi:L-fuculose-phosphate aldolase
MSVQTEVSQGRSLSSGLAAQMRGLTWCTRDKVALSCRILATEGHCFLLAGQITAAADEDASYLTAPWGPAFDEVRTTDLIRIDRDLEPVEGDMLPNPATRFHMWIYGNRPDVKAIVHTHPPYASALSMLGRPLVVSHMDATPLYDDCAFLAEWPGVPTADAEGELICSALGDNNAILLAHHGLLTTGTSVEQAVVRALVMENTARLQLHAESAGAILPIQRDLALEARGFLLQKGIVESTFASFARRALRADPGIIALPAAA